MNLHDRLELLATMTPTEVRAEWRRLFGASAPPAFGIALTTRAIAARYQEQAFGGLTKGELRTLQGQIRKNQRRPRSATVVKPGTWLSRTWHGEVHEVVVLDRGYEYRGARHQSLSAIAQKITGAKWSGPRFFGLHSSRLGTLKVGPSA
jgi:hypothetical protein